MIMQKSFAGKSVHLRQYKHFFHYVIIRFDFKCKIKLIYMYIGTVHAATITHIKRLVRPDTAGSDRLF